MAAMSALGLRKKFRHRMRRGQLLEDGDRMANAREGHREAQRARETDWDFWNVRFHGLGPSGGETHVQR